MNKFCKLCLITAYFMIFWMPIAARFAWNIGPIINSQIVPYLNLLYIIPFILTFLFGIIFSKEEFILFVIGSFLASLTINFISLFDSISGYNIDFLILSTYLPLILSIVFHVFIVTFLFSLGLLFNKYIINDILEIPNNINIIEKDSITD